MQNGEREPLALLPHSAFCIHHSAFGFMDAGGSRTLISCVQDRRLPVRRRTRAESPLSVKAVAAGLEPAGRFRTPLTAAPATRYGLRHSGARGNRTRHRVHAKDPRRHGMRPRSCLQWRWGESNPRPEKLAADLRQA